jgi:hypothetical protein
VDDPVTSGLGAAEVEHGGMVARHELTAAVWLEILEIRG